MPIFVKGELLQRSPVYATRNGQVESRETHWARQRLLPSTDETRPIVDIDTKAALDDLRIKSMMIPNKRNTLADDLSSIGSMSQRAPVRRAPPRSPDNYSNTVPAVIDRRWKDTLSRRGPSRQSRNLTIETHTAGTTMDSKESPYHWQYAESTSGNIHNNVYQNNESEYWNGPPS